MNRVLKAILLPALLLSAAALHGAAGASTPAPRPPAAPAPASIRFCCTTQQSIACTSQGGTPSCKTNVCQCLF